MRYANGFSRRAGGPFPSYPPSLPARDDPNADAGPSHESAVLSDPYCIFIEIRMWAVIFKGFLLPENNPGLTLFQILLHGPAGNGRARDRERTRGQKNPSPPPPPRVRSVVRSFSSSEFVLPV